jgi:hypothetical protein
VGIFTCFATDRPHFLTIMTVQQCGDFLHWVSFRRHAISVRSHWRQRFLSNESSCPNSTNCSIEFHHRSATESNNRVKVRCRRQCDPLVYFGSRSWSLSHLHCQILAAPCTASGDRIATHAASIATHEVTSCIASLKIGLPLIGASSDLIYTKRHSIFMKLCDIKVFTW